MAPPIPILFLIGVLFVLVARAYLNLTKKNRLPGGARPLPGPKALPLLGNVHQVPPEMSWMKFYEWSKVFGPIYQMEMFGSVHVWISSEQIVHDLLSKRSTIFSDRPVIPNLPDNKTSGNYLALAGHNETWKRQRKLCHHLMAVSNSKGLHSYPTRERDRFLYLMAHDPSNYIEWIEQFTGRTISRLSWGSPHSSNLLRETTFGLLETISPAGALPNVVSFLGVLPTSWSPWQKKERARHALEYRMITRNTAAVRTEMRERMATPSFTRTFLEDSDRSGRGDSAEHTDEAMYVVAQMAIAGALTIGSPIQSFLLAMCHYPGALAKLQAEIDVTLNGRCPQWEDREKLPRLRACVKETLRWRPPVPTGIPHASEKDDVYNGYFIPKGATIHALEWGITRNEEVYPDAETYNPDRWLDPAFPTYKEPLTVYPNLAGYSQFGFGRRTCQGVPIVDQDLFLAMGGLAWAFDIRKKIDPATGEAVPVAWNKYTNLLIAKPCKFQFDAVLREGKGRMLDLMASSAREMEEEEDRLRRSAHQPPAPPAGRPAPTIQGKPKLVLHSNGAATAQPSLPRRGGVKEIEIMSDTGTLASGTDSDGGSSPRSSILTSSDGELSENSSLSPTRLMARTLPPPASEASSEA